MIYSGHVTTINTVRELPVLLKVRVCGHLEDCGIAANFLKASENLWI